MLNLGPHAIFIVASYAVTFGAIGILAAATLADDRRQRRLLAGLEKRGITRRSAKKPRAAAKPSVTQTMPEKSPS